MILIVEGDPAQAGLISAALGRAGLAHALAPDAAALTARLAEGDATLALLDLDPPHLEALETLRLLRARHAHLPILALSAVGSVARAVAAIRAGADDLILKPVSEQRLETAVRSAIAAARKAALAAPADAAAAPEARPDARTGFGGVVARSAAIRDAIAIAERAAGSEAPLLLEGESGVGKEVFARAVHRGSRRAAGPFVAVNCGALPEALVESILFGHARGAFTGATDSRPGKFGEADGGVLFLDEVAELPQQAQVKLLRALQERVIDPVGATGPRPVDIRIMSATNRALAQEVAAGRFREDLYYRLSVLPIRIPPLRERREDIAPLAEHAARRLAAAEGRAPAVFSPEALEMLVLADWPGNVRQLENAVHRAMVLADGAPLAPRHFALDAPAPTLQPPAPSSAGHIRPLAEIEAEHIHRALIRYEWRIAETARRLGIGRSTLYRKIEELGLAARLASEG
ncbi:MAG: sigma 54-interacting transcriptional regulator [Rubrimonas sp.]|uniref:sigma-54 dependent transcriptional regulator n=1 Tax=Rubrimonas sp. TaxID=2036015 RepID=UPI002FDDBEEF